MLLHNVQISSIRQETGDVKTFVLETPEPIPYSAGQYLTFVFHHHGKEIRRSYSLASSPVLNEPLAITVKRVANGQVSRPLFDRARAGDELVTIGAGGFFVLPEVLLPGQQLFFLAAGSGIVPIFSLIKTALHLFPHIPVILIYSNRSEADTIFYEELKALQQKHASHFTIEFLFSTSANLLKARLNQSLLQILLKQYATASSPDILFYLCGPFPYMRMIEFELQTLGFTASQIRKEQFNTIRPPVRPVPPDTDPHQVELSFQGETYNLTVQYPQTILEAAKKNGIMLPYSCEVGKCGSCAATCTKGQVWMMYNEVLLNDEVRKGLVLTCTGFPVGGNATIVM